MAQNPSPTMDPLHQAESMVYMMGEEVCSFSLVSHAFYINLLFFHVFLSYMYFSLGETTCFNQPDSGSFTRGKLICS
jgi:hypothetical protein